MFEQLNNQYPTISKFFEGMIAKERIPNSIILYGTDIQAQYYFSLLLARGANCTGDKTISCNCQNCRWINANEHPAVMTFSKINSKPEGDESKTVISVKQIDIIKDKLMITSDYHRFFIFCDAEIKAVEEEEKNITERYNFNMKLPAIESQRWYPYGLTEKSFPEVSANSLLKSIEEPPQNVTFIFLTENTENIISTIVSRSQKFYVPNFEKTEYDINFPVKIFLNYPNINRQEAIKISEFLLKYSKDTGKSLTKIIYTIETYLTEIMKNNTDNIYIKNKIFEDISKLQNVMKMLKSSVREQTVADEVGYILTK